MPSDIAPGVRRVPNDGLPRGNYFAPPHYLRTAIPQGVTRNRSGTRLCALTQDFLLGFLRALQDECGSATPTVLRTCGRKWGQLLARRIEKELSAFHEQPLGEMTMAHFQACLEEMFRQHGWGLLRLDYSQTHQGLLLVELRNAIMADLVKKADKPADTMMAGILAGFFAHITDQDLDCVQTSCPAAGGDVSRFVIGLRSRIEQAAQWLENGKTHADIVAELAEVRV
ncbi:MAG: V4R domain-containing protein [Gemmataceae bacterium]